MDGAGSNELLEAATTLPAYLDRESFHSTPVADDTYCLRPGRGFGAVL
jgi:hypothetical protein